MKTLSRSIKHGAKIAGSEQASKMLIQVLRKAFGNSYPKFFDTELGKLIEPAILASAVHYLATEFAFVPQSMSVADVAEYCMQGAGREAMQAVLQRAAPVFEQISKIKIDGINETAVEK